jgi:hypothetical protein
MRRWRIYSFFACSKVTSHQQKAKAVSLSILSPFGLMQVCNFCVERKEGAVCMFLACIALS